MMAPRSPGWDPHRSRVVGLGLPWACQFVADSEAGKAPQWSQRPFCLPALLTCGLTTPHRSLGDCSIGSPPPAPCSPKAKFPHAQTTRTHLG